jgi:hypothetical protein
MLNRAARTTVLALSSAVALATLSGPPASAAACPSGQVCMTIVVDDQNASVPAAGNSLYVTLFGAGQATLARPNDTTFALGESVPLTDLVPAVGGSEGRFTIQTPQVAPLSSARLYFSEASLGGNQPPATAPYRYDYVEFTIVYNAGIATVNGDVTGIDQVGIPARMSFQDSKGNVLDNAGTSSPAVRSMGCWDDILSTVTTNAAPLKPTWDPSTIALTVPGTTKRLRLAGPSNMPTGIAAYPSMQQYIASLSGKTVTITGYFGGNTNPPLAATYYSYSGTFDASGNLALAGTLTSDKAGATPNPKYPSPQPIYLPARSLFDTMAPNGWWDTNTWGNPTAGYGTGFGVYAQNGPYQLGGTAPTSFETQLSAPGGTPTSVRSWALDPSYIGNGSIYYSSVGNDIYGWIYGDLVASLANGFVGPLGYDTKSWNTNNDATGTAYAAPQKAFADLYPSGTPAYAAWDLWQQAVATTSDSYGVSLGDRFAFQGAKSASPDMSTAQDTGIIEVTLLPKDGCGQPVSLEPSPQSLVLDVAGGDDPDEVLVLPPAQQPPTGVFHDFVTLSGVGFTPTSFTLDRALPDGMDFDTSTGVITGSPTVATAKTVYTITGTDGRSSASASVAITAGDWGVTPAVQHVDGVLGEALAPTTALTATGFDDAPVYSIAPSLPAGLNLDPTTGIVSGTPTLTSLPTPYTVTANTADQSASASIVIEVTDGWSILPATQLLAGTVGTALESSETLSIVPAAGTVVAPVFSVSPALPDGLTADPATGVISGTPRQAQSTSAYAITATGTDPSTGLAITAHAAVQITVAPALGPVPLPQPVPSPSSSPSPTPTASPTSMPSPTSTPSSTPTPTPTPTPSPTPTPTACPTGTVLIVTALGPRCAAIA